MLRDNYRSLLCHVKDITMILPAPVIVALISLVSTVSGARYKVHRDAQISQSERKAEEQKKKHEIEMHLRNTYNELASPILKSASKLAERLHILIDSEWNAIESMDSFTNNAPIYSAYLLGRYLATVEIIKRESSLMDYGLPAADRIMANILGRIQGLLSANDYLLEEMQKTEHAFKPASHQKPLKAGPLKVTPRAQTVLGELLLRKLWEDKYEFVHSYKGLDKGSKALITFLEFSQIIEQDKVMTKWYQPLIRDFTTLETAVRRLAPEKRRSNEIGARIYFLQSGLLDLVEFFDPLPNALHVPFYRRQRLHLGPLRYNEEHRAPESLHKLYKELANIRDHRVLGGNIEQRLKVSNEVEVFVAGVYGTGDTKIERNEVGECPYSHRVLIALHEMQVPYKAVPIPPDAKPQWYYLLHPENKTPTLYHNGNVIEESGQIISYLLQKFPKARRLGSSKHLHLAVGTAAFTKFHSYFVGFLQGTENAKEKLECELRKLDRTVKAAQDVNKRGVFLGGQRFSREDTGIAPFLHNIVVAGEKLKGWSLPEDCLALRKYLEGARNSASFSDTVAKNDIIIRGYGKVAMSEVEKWRLADMLE